MSTSGNRTSGEIKGLEEDARLEMGEMNARNLLTNTPEENKEKKSPSRFNWLRKRSPNSTADENSKPTKNACEPSVSTSSESPNKTQTEEVFTDVFENIQLQLEVIKGVKEKPWTMDRKLQIIRNAKNYVEQHSGDLNRLQHLKESRIRLFRQIKRQFQNFIVFFIPWEKRIKNIQGHFGAGIGSFFLFLRSLAWINFILLTFITIFVIVPQLMSPSTALSIPESERHTAQRLTAVLDAKGYLEYSFLFYGYYGNENIQVGVVEYPLPVAYFAVFMVIYLFSIITVLRAITHEQSLVKSSGQNDQYPFGWRVFSAWDFLITERETAENKLASLTTAIKEQMVEAVEKGKTINKKTLIALRVCANVLVLGVLSASAYLIYLVVKRSDERDKEGRPPTVLEQYEISLAITGMNAVCPVFFKLISMMEQYHPRVALYWELTRIMFMYLGNMYVLVISLLNKINQSKVTALDVSSTSDVINSTVIPVTTVTKNTTDGSLCWETTVGQELFKLTIIDLVALVFSVLTGDLCVSLTVRFLNCFQGRLLDLEKILGYPEFKLAENVLQLINSQGLIWMGLVFSPGLIMLNILKLVIIMYLRSWAVMVTNVPPKRIFKASHRFYLVLLLVMLFLCMLAVGYAAVEIEPSKWCGPFRGKPNMYRVLTESIDNGPALLDTIVDYLSGPSVVIPVFILMSIAIYYYRSEANYLRRSNRELGLQLQYERAEDRKKTFKRASERYSNNSDDDKVPSLPSGQTRHSKTKSRNKSRQISDNGTNDIKEHEPPRTVAKKSSQMKQLQPREDTIPIVTYDGVMEETSTESVLNSIQDHRQVKVIIHRTSSSSSSTVSSVRSVDQRITIPKKKHLRSRDHVHESQRCQNNIENTESEIQNTEKNSSGSSVQESLHCEESIALQVTDEVKNNNEGCKTGQQTILEGGSLAAMFDS